MISLRLTSRANKLLDKLEEVALQVSHLIPLFHCKTCIVRLVSRFCQCFKYAYVVHIFVFCYIIWLVCFYDLLNKGVFRTLSNIQDGAFHENS